MKSCAEPDVSRSCPFSFTSLPSGEGMILSSGRAGLGELSALAAHSSRSFEREALLEYVSQWTIKRTGQPEPLVREVLGCAGRWLDEVYNECLDRQPEVLGESPDSDEGAEPVP